MIQEKKIKIVLNDEPTLIEKEEKIVHNVKLEGSVPTKVEKYHLPVLKLNNPDEWPSAPLEKRKHFTDKVAMETCLGNCCGVNGLKSACCTIDPENLEHVLGPLNGADEEKIKELINYFNSRGLKMSRSDIVIDYEEGKEMAAALFNNHPVFLEKSSYPIIRMQLIGKRYACKFLNPVSGKCQIYERRFIMCSGYLCEYIKSNFLVRTADKPNTYRKLR